MTYTADQRAAKHRAGRLKTGWVDPDELLSLMVAHPDWTLVELARTLGVRVQTVGRVSRMPEFREQFAAARAAAVGPPPPLGSDRG